MRRLLRTNGLSLTVFGIFFAMLIGQSVVGERVYNQNQLEHGETAISYRAYLETRSFLEVTFENWESEFLQMAAYVLLTAYLFQRGSVESKDPGQFPPDSSDVQIPPSSGSPNAIAVDLQY